MSAEAARLREMLIGLIEPLIDQPDEARVEAEDKGHTVVVRVCVQPRDMGKVIGRGGVRAQAIRKLMKAYGNTIRRRVIVDIAD